MDYHLPRVMHWIQDHNVRPYPVVYPNQLATPPGVEYTFAHLRLLTGSDRFFNLVELAGYVGCAILASLVADELGLGLRGQLAAATFCLTLPIAILQATDSMVDIAATYWMSCFAYSILRIVRRASLGTMMAAATALGLAMLAKGTAYVICFPFAIWGLVHLVRRSRRQALALAGWMLVAVVVLSGPLWMRNYAIFGSPWPDKGMRPYDVTTDTLSARKLAANLVKQVSMHLWFGSDAVNAPIEAAVRGFHAWLGVDVDDEDIVLTPNHYKIHQRRDEGQAAAPVHLLLGLSLVLVFVGRRASPGLRGYSACCLVAALLMPLAFKWQPDISRFHMPVFILAMPAAAAVLGARLGPRAMLALMALLFAYAAPVVLDNPQHAAGPFGYFGAERLGQHFYHHPSVEPAYRELTEVVRREKVKTIGLKLRYIYFEYPLWVALLPEGVTRIEHIDVGDVQHYIAPSEDDARFQSFVPDAIIWGDQLQPPPAGLWRKGAHYHLVWSDGNFGFLERDGLGANPAPANTQ